MHTVHLMAERSILQDGEFEYSVPYCGTIIDSELVSVLKIIWRGCAGNKLIEKLNNFFSDQDFHPCYGTTMPLKWQMKSCAIQGHLEFKNTFISPQARFCDHMGNKDSWSMYPSHKKSVAVYYNMTVWILAGNYISFTIAAGLIRLHMPGVKKSRV